jgi:hypothetical protein
MINSARLDPLLADRFSRIDWDMRKQSILLGDLASLVPVLPNILPKSFLMKLGLVIAYSLDVAKIKAKYSSKSTDTCSAAFWSII